MVTKPRTLGLETDLNRFYVVNIYGSQVRSIDLLYSSCYDASN